MYYCPVASLRVFANALYSICGLLTLWCTPSLSFPFFKDLRAVTHLAALDPTPLLLIAFLAPYPRQSCFSDGRNFSGLSTQVVHDSLSSFEFYVGFLGELESRLLAELKGLRLHRAPWISTRPSYSRFESPLPLSLFLSPIDLRSLFLAKTPPVLTCLFFRFL